MKAETVGETLQRLAKASLPHLDKFGPDKARGRYCDCGELLPAIPKTRQRRLVCDDCAAIIPRENSGRRPSHTCAGCHVVTPRLKMKMKDGEFFCKKCLKIKFDIDF